MNKPIEITEEPRLCGTRAPGGLYAVSDSVAVGAGITLPAGLGGLVLLEPPLPIEASWVPNKRGINYCDGAALERGGFTDGLPLRGADVAEYGRHCWQAFGLPIMTRLPDAAQVAQVVDALLGLQWVALAAQDKATQWAAVAVQALRGLAQAEPAPKWRPAVVAAEQLYTVLMRAQLYDWTPTGCGGALAAAWRLWHAVQAPFEAVWFLPPESVTQVLGYIYSPDVAITTSYAPAAGRIYADLVDWVGANNYARADDFIAEARNVVAGRAQGVSRRLPSNARGIVPAWSRSYLAHAAVTFPDGSVGPGIFGHYTVAQVQYICKSARDSVPAALHGLAVQPVRVLAGGGLFAAEVLDGD